MGVSFRYHPEMNHPLVRTVADYVCRELNVSPLVLRNSRVRDRTLAAARHIIWYVLHDIGLCSHSDLAKLFIMDRATVIYGVNVINRIIKTPALMCGKGLLYTRERKELLRRVAKEARTMALAAINRQAEGPIKDIITIPVFRLVMDELENLAMADLSTRFSGGWLIELSEFFRIPDKYPLPVRIVLAQEKEAKFAWVIPTLSEGKCAPTTSVSSKDSTRSSQLTTTAEPEKDPTTSPEIQMKPNTTPLSKPQTQHA